MTAQPAHPLSTPPHGLLLAPRRARVWLNVTVPAPTPDVVPVPPSTQPGPPPAAVPPKVTEPTLPGQFEPVRDPSSSALSPMICRLH